MLYYRWFIEWLNNCGFRTLFRIIEKGVYVCEIISEKYSDFRS